MKPNLAHESVAPRRVFFLKNHTFFVQALHCLFEGKGGQLEIIGHATTLEEAMFWLDSGQPTDAPYLAGTDLKLPNGDDTEFMRQLRTRRSEVKIALRSAE